MTHKSLLSFHLNTFWFHLTHQGNNVWQDQHGERWLYHSGWFRHEHGVMQYNFFRKEDGEVGKVKSDVKIIHELPY